MASTFQNGLKKVSFFIKGIIFPYQTSKIPPRANPVSLLENFPDSPAWQNSIFRAKTRIREQFFLQKLFHPKFFTAATIFTRAKIFFSGRKKNIILKNGEDVWLTFKTRGKNGEVHY